jgi:hypothetical protein
MLLTFFTQVPQSIPGILATSISQVGGGGIGGGGGGIQQVVALTPAALLVH